MTILERHDFSSLKYLTASFIATYCSGLVHPLDVIKTRLQSNFSVTQATTEEVLQRILSPSTATYKMLLDTSTGTKACVDCTKDSTSPCFAKRAQCHYSSGCTHHLRKVLNPQETLLGKKLSCHGCCDDSQCRSRADCHACHPADLGR